MDTNDQNKVSGFIKHKRIIIISIIVVLLLIISAILARNIHRNNNITESGSDDVVYDTESGVFSYSDIEVVADDGDYTYSEGEKFEGERRIYLTFDDGPGPNTDRILDILKKYDVKATFFVVGKDDKYIDQYKRIVEEGHTLGMHSYSHKYDEIYKSLDTFSEDLSKLQEYLYDITGVWSRVYRFPGGSSNNVSHVNIDKLIDYLNDQGIVYFDWNIASGDAVKEGISADRIVNNCIRNLDKYEECVILLHDLPEKGTTVEALNVLIPKLLNMDNTVILPITDETVPVQHVPSQVNDIEE